MKKNCLALIICLLTSNLIKTSNIRDNKLRVDYYSTVEFVETPLSYIKGSIPLEKEIALNRNHYRFSYNSKNELVSIAFYNGSTPKSPNHTANLFTLAHRMEFSYDDETEKVIFFNTRGERITVLGNCSEFVYTKNQLGFRESLHFLDSFENRVENSWNIFEYTWEYLNDGGVIENRFNEEKKQVSIRPGFEFYRLKLYFNNAGHISLMQNIDKEGNLVENNSGASQDNITTNSNGNFLQWQVLNNQYQLEKGNGPDVAIGLQEFNEFGYEIGLEHLDENNKPIYSAYGICRSKTKFDKYGNIYERTFYNEANEPSVHKEAGYHKLIIEWDEPGNDRNLLTYYDIDNNPVIHKTRGYHAVKYEYNGNNLIKISYLDTSYALVNRRDNGISYFSYQYDNEGKQTDILRFDKDGKKL
ncbi:hypothetical protein D7030_12270 [Flavobacteriaceae bacterium AU392]|nr:hypothetical protein D1817_12395 [Flavobacteriaceae bacterium]RKM82923.1 hypothetical protein D7030_12270 [Flavobacteriaceae bacterium AU392]